MSWKRQKSKVSLRNLLRNKKTAVIAAVCCVAVVGAYVGFHRPTSEAANENCIRGVLNCNETTDASGKESLEYSVKSFSTDANASDISVDINAKSGDRKTLGTPSNPFVILELVPWQGFSEMGYMIEGCEPIDIYTRCGVYNKEKSAYYREAGQESVYDSYNGTNGGPDWTNVGSTVTECFPEEEYPGKGLSEDDADYKYRWLKNTDANGHTIKGYYEKVAGTKIKGSFNITDVDNNGRPVFTKVDDGDFIWVSLGSNAPLYDYHKKKENKSFQAGNSLSEVKSAYAAGDREYTTRTENTYYYMSNSNYYVDENGVQHYDLVPKCMFVHYNDFLRYSLRIRTKEDVDQYSIVVKPVEPDQINAHPELINYADLIYIHISSESGIASNSITMGATQYEYFNSAKTNADKDSTFYTNDISWEVAERLYFKANALTKYKYKEDGTVDKVEFDYSGDDQYGYAPVILAKTILDTLKGGDTHNDTTYFLNYDEMTLNKSYSGGNKGRDNNFYKFCLMDLLMDQDTFYDMFYTPLDSTHQPVIQTKNGKGYNTIQTGDAQTYWCPEAFLPYIKGITNQYGWGTDAGKELCEKYGINFYSNSFMNFPGSAILSYTYIYNSDGKIFVLGSTENLDEDAEYTAGAFDWFKERDEHYSSLSTLDIIYFMLNYSKGGNNTTGSRTKKSIRSLEIEPSNDFYLNETSLKALLPSTKYKMTIEPPVHMTTAEFNGSKIDLSEYDLVYVGTCRGKMNTVVQNLDHGSNGWYEEDDARYNDTNLTGKLYLHVGDMIKNGSDRYRLSGTDITDQQMKNLVAYAKSGEALVFDDVLYNYTASGNSLYNRNVDITSNMDALIGKVNSRSNVVALTKLKSSNNVVSTTEKGAAVSITTPKPYYNPENPDEEDERQVNATLTGNKLKFTFTIGYPGDDNVKEDKNTKYGVRLYVDSNGDGIITEAEDGSELCTWDSDAKTGAVYAAGTKDASGTEQKAQYSITYTVDKERTNGAIAWKFEVFSIDNENIKTTVSGVSRYVGNEKNDEKVKNEIKVLQVIPNEEYKDSSSKANLEKELTKTKSSSLFAKYAKDLEDYEITVKTIPLSQSATTVEKMGYLNAFAYVNSSDYDETSNARENFTGGGEFYYPSEYKDYDVYLFSCGDAFEKADNSNGAVAFAYWLSENGRSVIYTADSIYDADTSSVDGVKKLLKDSAGLSRYTSTSESTKKYNDTASYTDSSNKSAEYKSSDYEGYENLEYTYNKLTELGKASDNTYLAFKNDTWKKKDGSAVAYGSDTEKTQTLSQINKGTICVYPYTISDPETDIIDRFEEENLVPISGYASQDYQVNLKNPMADVWYCLYGDEDTTYGISPNDAANNYYLYNVDNVFYSGISLDSSGTTRLEMQLFINTLIGASEASYDYPYITADKLEIRDVASDEDSEETEPPTEEELKIKLVSTSDEERNYKFSVSGNTSQLIEDYQYKEYVAHASAIPKSSPTPKPTPTQKPTPSPTPTLDPDATAAPTEEPKATPIALMENPLGSTGVKWETKNAAWMKDLSNDAILQFSYRCNNKVDGTSYVLETHGGYDNWGYGKFFTACVDGSTDSTDIQVVRMTVGEFKQSFETKVALNDDLVYVCLQPYQSNGNVVLLSVRLYLDDNLNTDDTDPSIDEGDTPGDDTKAEEEEVTDTDFLTDTDTHKIYFTPHDGNLVGGNIKAVTAAFVSDKNDDANTLTQPINSIYREKKSGAELKTFRMTDPNGGGQFLESEKRFLTDSVQYYFPYNKTYVSVYPYIKLTIRNKKKSSVTYIEVDDLVTQKKDTKDVYMFNLD